MHAFQAVILGLVEGFTEFLPISSTGHMIVVSQWLGLPQDSANKAFEVIIQLAAILAVVAKYRDKLTFRHIELWKKVVLAFIPVGVVGLLFYKQIKAMFSIEIVATMFIVGGVVFLIVERFYREDRAHVANAEDLSYRQALWIGIAQVFSLIPGTSRAGATIVGGLLVGLNRTASAEFSFLLALPVMAAASGLDLLKHYREFQESNLLHLGIGFAVAFVVAYLTMKLFISFLSRFTFVGFGVYRIAFGLVLLLLYR
ncbi:MAG TPA: undecaprenyl-diphosphate phosphatase [Gammaproteobacteria bacterium]|nr:undecaprenyl-diphosphate phosphatase [Gammaproteobacteria bacterium]